jgi:zinc protease
MKRFSVAIALGLFLLAPAVLGAPADRSKPPASGPVKPLKLPPAQRFTLGNGLPVFLVESHEVPVASIVLVIRTGAASDPLTKPGLASFTADMLDEGAAGKDSLALDDAISFLGADLSTGSSWDASSVSLHVPVARLDKALTLMADVALRPDFPEKELKRLKKEALTALLQARSEARQIASRAFSKALFGENQRYGLPAGGTARSIAALTAEDLRAFYKAQYQPGNAALIAVGDVQPATILPLLEKAFGSWTAGGATPPPLPVPPHVKGRTILLVDKPGAAQSVLRAGRVGPDRRTPDYADLEVMNTLLGASYTSRLNDNLREQHGYSYGASSRFDYRRSAGVFLAAADVQTKVTGEAMSEFMKELERIKTPATAVEVERARNFLALRFPEQFETTGQIASKLAAQFVYGLPADTWDSFVPKALGVSATALQKAAASQVDTKNMVFVVVGDRSIVEKPLRALNLGEIKVLSVEDVMGPPPIVE